MIYFCRLVLLTLLAGSLALPSLCKRWTHSVHLGRCRIELPYCESWEVPPLLSGEELSAALAQKFYYLDRGSQSFVFESEDGRFVLKLFFFDAPTLLERLGLCKSDCRRALFKANRICEGCRIASVLMTAETGIAYAHLNLKQERCPAALIGPAWKRVCADLSQCRFVLQYKATPFETALLESYRNKDLTGFLQRIDSLQQLFRKRSGLGIRNSDPKVIRNLGFRGCEAMEIDVGNYFCSKGKEAVNSIGEVLVWIDTHLPEWRHEARQRMESSS